VATTVSGAGMGVAVEVKVEVPLHAARSRKRLKVMGMIAINFFIIKLLSIPRCPTRVVWGAAI
jgi:hypothetical protein